MVARSAITLVVPFAAYILAEEVHASGVVAVVVTALEMQRHSRPQDAAERVTRRAFWDVVELLVTGLAFGLVGLEIRQVVVEEGSRASSACSALPQWCASWCSRCGSCWMAGLAWLARGKERRAAAHVRPRTC